MRFEVGGFVVNEGVVHRTPVANHKSRLQTHHFLGRAEANLISSKTLSLMVYTTIPVAFSFVGHDIPIGWLL